MTLTDIFDIKKETVKLGAYGEVVSLLDDYGEDIDITDAEKILSNSNTDAFSIKDGSAFLCGKIIRCTVCGNNEPNKILSNACEVLSANVNTHFGCCECGNTFLFEETG